MHHLRSALLGALLLVVARTCAAQDVRLMVCGREVEPPGTTAVSDGLLIAPLKAPLEAFGAAVALGADGRHIEVTLADGRAATLEVGGSTLTIDGVKRRLKRPVRLVGGVSVGPVADVLAALGADVRWDNETKTLYASARIRSVDVEGDESGVAVRIVTSAPVAFDAPKRLLDPPRLYVDVRGASGPFEGDSRVVGVAGVKRVRWARHSADPPSVRVVLDLERPMEPTWMVGRERMSARLAVGAPSAGAAALASEMAK
ncbi:MAG: stalk domain-containing protein, partial [Armatimonadota bacterium]